MLTGTPRPIQALGEWTGPSLAGSVPLFPSHWSLLPYPPPRVSSPEGPGSWPSLSRPRLFLQPSPKRTWALGW